MKTDAKRIEFGDITNRLRRNLMALAVLIVSIVYFDIEIKRAVAQGAYFEGLTTDVVVTILIVVLLYHAISFAIHAFEDYRYWEITFANSEVMTHGGGFAPVNVVRKLKELMPAIEKLASLQSSRTDKGLSDNEIRALHDLIPEISMYAQRFQNFPTITRVRFWLWDIGLAVIGTAAAIFFSADYFSILR